MLKEQDHKQKDSIIRNFFDAEGRLKNIPSQLKKKLIILEHLVGQLDMGKVYEEKEINEFIRRYHADFATVRREFIVQGFMTRENEKYVRTPLSDARRWEELS